MFMCKRDEVFVKALSSGITARMSGRRPFTHAPSRPTLADVARLARVSPATASRALTQGDTVRGETRRRVLSAVDTLGYRPNRAARELSTGRSGALGMLVPDIANPFFAELIRSAQAAARGQDKLLLIADTSQSEAQELDLLESLSGQIDGVIICSSRLRVERLGPSMAGLPMVFVNRREDAVPAVVIDQGAIVRVSVRHLTDLGHRHLAFLAGPEHLWSSRRRVEALHAFESSGDLTLDILGPFEPSFEGGAKAAEPLLASGATGVLAFNDVMALGLMSRLSALGVSVPKDLSVVGSDDVPLANMWTPALTTVSAPTRAAGSNAVDLLCGLIVERGQAAAAGSASGAPAPLQRIELEGHLVVRASTAEKRP